MEAHNHRALVYKNEFTLKNKKIQIAEQNCFVKSLCEGIIFGNTVNNIMHVSRFQQGREREREEKIR
jgi:hypothetical protein